MKLSSLILTSTVLLAGLSQAQTQTVRGEVEDVQGTANQFFLKCTNIPVISSTVNLQALQAQNVQAILDVINVGTPGNPILDLQSYTVTTKVMDMGNLRIGRSERWQVNAPAGSLAFVFVDFTGNTGYTPFGQIGTWLLGPGASTIRSGVTNGVGQFEFSFTMPNVQGLVGTSFTSQALVGTNGTFSLTNPDCKEVRN